MGDLCSCPIFLSFREALDWRVSLEDMEGPVYDPDSLCKSCYFVNTEMCDPLQKTLRNYWDALSTNGDELTTSITDCDSYACNIEGAETL